MEVTSMDDLLRRIQADQRKHGDAIRPAAGDAQIARLKRLAREVFAADLPDGYLDFLRRSDGLDYNGVVIYGCAASPEQPAGNFWQDFVAANQAWRDNPANAALLIFGDSDMDLYAFDLRSHRLKR
jgi:hypothetical protein